MPVASVADDAAMTTKYGVFSERPGIGHGDPYCDTIKPPEKDHGLNFKVAVCKGGKVRLWLCKIASCCAAGFHSGGLELRVTSYQQPAHSCGSSRCHTSAEYALCTAAVHLRTQQLHPSNLACA